MGKFKPTKPVEILEKRLEQIKAMKAKCLEKREALWMEMTKLTGQEVAYEHAIKILEGGENV